MTGLLALSTAATLALVGGAIVALAFVAGLIALAIRRRGAAGPDIPPGMRPGPADEALERRNLEKTMIWGFLFMGIIALWIPGIWLGEPDQNVDDAIELIRRSEERGSQWFQVADEENPTGFGCARCHGQQAQGGSVPFTPEGEQEAVQYPVPALVDVCGRLTVDEIRMTIEEGREGTPMPSWSIRFAGPMNDQQINDLITHLITIQEVPEGTTNLCLNPPVAGEEEPQPGPSAPASPAATPGVPSSGGGGDGGGNGGGQGSPDPEASPAEESA